MCLEMGMIRDEESVDYTKVFIILSLRFMPWIVTQWVSGYYNNNSNNNNNNNNNFHKQNYKFQYTVLKLHKSFRLLLQPCSQ